MKISPNYNLSFKSIPIYQAKVKKSCICGNVKFVDAIFSELSSKSEEDKDAMYKIVNEWGNAEYIGCIYEHFLDGPDTKIYALELVNSKELNKRILGIASIGWDNYLNFLQTKQGGQNREFRGAGEVMMWGLVKEAKKNIPEMPITLMATQNSSGFYQKIGLVPNGCGLNADFYLPNRKRDDFLRNIETKYHFDVNV